MRKIKSWHHFVFMIFCFSSFDRKRLSHAIFRSFAFLNDDDVNLCSYVDDQHLLQLFREGF